MGNTFLIHDNGGRPFKVKIKNNTLVSIFEKPNGVYDGTKNYNDIPFAVFNAERIFIGEHTDGKYRGNSILLYLGDKDYVYVGQVIYTFKSLNEITSYHSRIGNSDVPYPYAIDDKNNYYLFEENVIIKMNAESQEEPYHYYYWDFPTLPIFAVDSGDDDSDNNDPVDAGDRPHGPYKLNYRSQLIEDYDRRITDSGRKYFVNEENGLRRYLTKDEFIEIVTEYETLNEIKNINVISIIHNRIW